MSKEVKVDKLRFLDELDFITSKCAEMAQEYAMLRGAMDSLEGLQGKIERESFLKSSTIRFFNEAKNLRIARSISVVWAMSERNDRRANLSSLSSETPSKGAARFDEVKFSGDMTLMRLCNMYRTALKAHPDILIANVVERKKYLPDCEVIEIALRSRSTMDNLCSQIDNHLSDEETWDKVHHFRNTTAHSIRYSTVTIDKNWTDIDPDLKYNALFSYGNRAAQIAVAFRRAWTLSNACSGVDDLAGSIKEEYDEFWVNFFENPHFYEG